MNYEILKDALINGWQQVEKVYRTGKICSERHLQAELFLALSNHQDFKNEYDIFIESNIQIKGFTSNKTPDVVITRRNEIIAFIELKYVPHDYIKYKGDIEKLEKIHQSIVETKLLIDPKSGKYTNDIFTSSKNTILAYGLFTRHDSAVFGELTDEKWNDKKYLFMTTAIRYSEKETQNNEVKSEIRCNF